jgi:hypothetical protein
LDKNSPPTNRFVLVFWRVSYAWLPPFYSLGTCGGARILEAESIKEAKIGEAKLAKDLKIEGRRWKAFSIASQSAQDTLNLTHLQRQGKSHSLVVSVPWICRFWTDQMMIVDVGPLP